MSFEPLTPERRRQQTRDHLLEAAAQVFAERGFDGATLDEVAAVAGFTKGAVYSNFKNKDDLFLALLESRYEQEMQSVLRTIEATADHPEAHLADFVDLLREQFDAPGNNNWGGLYQQFFSYALHNPAARAKLAEFERADIASVAKIFEDERARHGIRGHESAEDSARIVVAVIRGLWAQRLLDPDAVDGSILESAISFIARALTAE